MRRFRKTGRVVERDIRGERILVPLAGSMEALDSIYTLNRTAASIWDGAGEGLSDDELAGRLVSAFDVSASRAHDDVDEVLHALLEMGALEESAC